MHPMFVRPVSFRIKRERLHKCSPLSTQLDVSLCLRSQTVIASAQGWAAARLSLPSVETLDTDSKAAELPGIHFVEPPVITTEDLLQIVRGETPDDWINEILHALLGWRKLEYGEWNNDLVPHEWKHVYPDGPPDFIGKIDDYTPATDRPVKKAVQKLTRSIPTQYKQILPDVLGPKGFEGWSVNELTPNRTRRATAVNWILYWYRVHYPDYQWS